MKLRRIPTYVHGIMDYALSAMVLSNPSTLGFPKRGWARRVPRMGAAGMAGMSAMTDYEWGVFRRIPMKYHLVADMARAAAIAASPWLFGFKSRRKRSWLPHVIVGAAVATTAAMTETQPRRWRLWTRERAA